MNGEHYLRRLFEPRSVVLVGASERPERVGTLMFDNLRNAGFKGEIFAVNPRYSQLHGMRCYPSVTKLPGPVDLAVIATPAHTVAGVVSECGAAGIPNAVVISAGFSEVGPEGVALEKALLEAARAARVRLLGPNCIGVMRPTDGLNASFARGNPLPGSLALVAQSGAVCTAMLDWATPIGIGFSSVVSLGGSVDVDFGEVIDYLASDEKTRHILLYIEGIHDGRRLVSSLRAAARAKPVILMKVGRHPAGSRAAVSHTGAVVGKDDVFDAVVQRTGAVRVSSIAELLGAAQALAANVRPRGDRLAVITNGGGPGVMAADRAGELGLPLATLSPATLQSLAAVLPPTWSHGNPIDLMGDADAARYRAALKACMDDPGVDGIVVILAPQAMTNADEVAQAVAEAAHGARKPVIASWMGEASVARSRAWLRKEGVTVFTAPEWAVDTFSHLASFYRNQIALMQAPGPLAHSDPPDVTAARALIRAALASGRNVLSSTESKALLAAFRIPVVRSVVVNDEKQAVEAAALLRGPVAMKIDSPDITHKSDVGGVKLGVAGGEDVRTAYREIMAAAAAHAPGARLRGVAIEPMATRAHGRELMVGIVRDAIFGPAVTFGAGGIAIEVLRDRAVALPPLNAALVENMVRHTRVARMLGDFRNLPAVDRNALDAVLLRVSEIACELAEVEELDVNPLFADESGVVAVDARIVVSEVPPGRRPYGHLAIQPYPASLQTSVTLGGERVTIRPIRPEDARIEAAFVEGLSAETRRMRFVSGLKALTAEMLARFTQIDYDREMALVATVGEGAEECQVAVARYVTLPDARSCEYAIVVADTWQGRGLGRVMMERLIEVARLAGLRTMVGWVVTGNSGMLKLCNKLGFVEHRQADDPQTRYVELQLGA
ncbi:MAG TPA: GNAT family N-acetyltransferase [Usitatibacter sp.]|nr:GNAT family N-acetyltransferase [Usitatibacter sp.]